MANNSILVLDDDVDVGLAAQLLLRRRFGNVTCVQHPRNLSLIMEQVRPEVLLLDLNFSPGAFDGSEGMEILRRVVARNEAPSVIVMTAYGEIPLAVEALKVGAFDFITKPWDNEKLVATIDAAISNRKRPPTKTDELLMGNSKLMQELRLLIASVARTDASVLILGESGVGKELVARSIHVQSRRADRVFMQVDIGALPSTTIESELFGHRKGSFTDASADRAGRFQSARGGTLFLDEIGNLKLDNQAKVLTVLERREITPLGMDKPVAIDVRIISATNMDESSLRDPAHFRLDLLHRLNTIIVRVPPLRAHAEDISVLAEHFLRMYCFQHETTFRPLSQTAQHALELAKWTGNVRELRHACERAAILGTGKFFEADDFALAGEPASESGNTSGLRLDERECAAIQQAMRETNGNISKAAHLLGVSRAALYRKIAKHAI